MIENIDMQVLICVVLAFLVSGVASFVISPLIMRFAKLVGAVDIPQDERRMHKKPVTRLGGLAIYFGFIVAVLLFNDIGPQIRGILIGSVIIVVLGVLDDILRLKAWIKFLVQIVAALVPALSGVVIQYFSDPLFFFKDGALPYFSLGNLAVPITVIWIVLITNSVILIDGLDGLAAGISLIASLSMLVISLVLQNPYVALLMAALAGACLGFMPFNMNPAKMFMGDTGALFLGYMLATASILGLFKFYALISFAVPFLVLGLPIFDTASAILRRISKGKSPMSADRGHVHHRLIDMGFTQKQSVAILYVMSAALGLSAVVITTSGEIKAIILLLALLVACAVGLRIFMVSRRNTPPAPSENTPEASEPQTITQMLDTSGASPDDTEGYQPVISDDGISEADTGGANLGLSPMEPLAVEAEPTLQSIMEESHD